MPYIFAANLNDAFVSQGFATAQDRIFQMFITRLLVQGRLSEVFGDAALETDKLMRTLGVRPKSIGNYLRIRIGLFLMPMLLVLIPLFMNTQKTYQ